MTEGLVIPMPTLPSLATVMAVFQTIFSLALPEPEIVPVEVAVKVVPTLLLVAPKIVKLLPDAEEPAIVIV